MRDEAAAGRCEAGSDPGAGGRPGRARRWAGILALGTVLAVLAEVEERVWTAAGSGAPAGPSRGGPRDLRPIGTLSHSGAGFSFPDRVGPFERRRVLQYDADGLDLSAGYVAIVGDERPLPVEATVFVYRKRPGDHVDGAFGRTVRAIEDQHPGARLESRRTIVLSGGRFRGRCAVFAYEEPWGGSAEPVALRSSLVLYDWSGWWVKWRVTTPAPIDEPRMRAIEDLAESLLPPETETKEVE